LQLAQKHSEKNRLKGGEKNKMAYKIKSKKLKEKLCKICGKRKVAPYEFVGQGKYCEVCLKKENKIWEREAGFN